MKIQLIDVTAAPSGAVILGKKAALVELDRDCISIDARGHTYHLRGTFYYTRINGVVKRIAEKTRIEQLRQVFESQDVESFADNVEGEFVGVAINRSSQRISIFGDAFNRRPLFYSINNGNFVASDNLPEVVKISGKSGYDQVSLYNYFLLGYAPGRDTFYSGVRKLGADETILLTTEGARISVVQRPKSIREYGRSDIQRYDDTIRNAVASRSASGPNVIMNSGGWDSTSLVYLLGEAQGRKNIQSIVFDVRLKDGQSFNVYEVDKVRRISDYYGIPSEACVIDYGSRASIDTWERNLTNLRDTHTYFWIHHIALADQVAKNVGAGTPVFSGEASDSIHNFGYSQWVSVNYDSMALREIADKAKTYLYGPTFFSRIQDGSYDQDKVYQFFKSYYGEQRFSATAGLGAAELTRKYLEAFVLSYPRVPFAKWRNEQIVLPSLNREYDQRVGEEYFGNIVRNITSQNIYFHLLQLYRSFHFQSAQIGIAQVALSKHGLSCKMPFLDLEMIDYMYSMPENWGRGLELRTTKYPLRYLASEKWDMPLHILDEAGPHSYIAENDKKWTYSGGQWDIYCEILFNSVFTDHFRANLAKVRIEDTLDPNAFNVSFIQSVINDYAAGKQDIPNHGLLFKLALLFGIGLIK